MKIFIWGAGGQGRVVLDILRTNNQVEVIGFVDSNQKLKGKIVDGVEVLGGKEVLVSLKKHKVKSGIVAIGNNRERCEVADFLSQNKFSLINAIHPTAIIASNVSIGKNVTIAAGVIVCIHSIIEDNVIINTGTIIEHENIIRKGTHVASGVKTAGLVEIGERVFIGMGSTIIQCVKIGRKAVIGAGAVVLKNIPASSLAVGVPARVKRRVTEKDVL